MQDEVFELVFVALNLKKSLMVVIVLNFIEICQIVVLDCFFDPQDTPGIELLLFASKFGVLV